MVFSGSGFTDWMEVIIGEQVYTTDQVNFEADGDIFSIRLSGTAAEREPEFVCLAGFKRRNLCQIRL
jgi:hypothetical protein